jgi:16S rRNA (cytosine1402-N4)-methyltransferase
MSTTSDVSKSRNFTAHNPVMLHEMLRYLSPKDGGVYVDATFGAGGYSRAILEAADCRVIAIDRDPSVVPFAEELQKQYGERFCFKLSLFSEIATALSNVCPAAERIIDGVVFDFGLSSMQLEDSERGFSFQSDGPLDMRMGSSVDTSLTAGQVVNTFSKDELRKIIALYGEERLASRVASAIVAKRPFSSTTQLADVIRSVVPRFGTIDPATRTFQGIRIFVNDELKEIATALKSLEAFVFERQLRDIKVITVSFHALEDAVVKGWIKKRSPDFRWGVMPKEISQFIRNNGRPKEERLHPNYDYWAENNMAVGVVEDVRGVVTPSSEELLSNHRARSAKLRAVTIGYDRELQGARAKDVREDLDMIENRVLGLIKDLKRAKSR